MSKPQQPLNPPSASRQVTFYESLLVARRTWLDEALRTALASVDPKVLRQQLLTYVPLDAQQILQQRGIRDEEVFPTPVVLETKPTLVGYYRLLSGVGQKTFYRSSTGMGPFSRMENEGLLLPKTRALLPAFSTAMATVLADLIRQTAQTLEQRDIHDLQLLTLGSNFYGGANNAIGQAAISGVLTAIATALGSSVTRNTGRELSVETPSGRLISVIVSNDPDVAVRDVTGLQANNLLAIEVKGGSDAANVYNRGGEAEKSHQGAKGAGFQQCWTVIHMGGGIDVDKLLRGSPTTDEWFDTAQVVGQSGPDWDKLRDQIRRIVGLS